MYPFYITTPIYYVNANPHLGHAYTTILADAVTRFHMMLGEKTLFLTGSDEHGDKIVQAAEAKNLSPEAFVDEISSHFRALWPQLGAKPNHFTRTTDKLHVEAVQEFLRRLYDSGDIYFGEFGGFYCYGCERFYTEKELENGLCPQHLTKPEFISEKNYFFRMSRYLPWLKEYISANPDLVRPERYRREALAMLEDGVLEDLCISRPKSRLTWGIELPFDKEYVCYVWLDALISYISGLDWPDGEEFRTFWPGEHLIAKDILKPHAIFWPCLLKAAGIPIYRHLDVHGYWLVRDTKMSKSLGNIIEPLAMTERFGLDAFRYFLLRDMRFGSDASFSEDSIITRINADLANDLGNLFSRVLSMTGKYFSGAVPAPGDPEPDDHAIIALCGHSLKNFVQLFKNMETALGLESLWELARGLNKYVDTQAPWALHKAGNMTRLGTVMAVLLVCLRKLALCLWPVMPDASLKMLEQLGEKIPEKKNEATVEPPVTNLVEECEKFAFLPQGRQVSVSSNLFPRIDYKPEPQKAPAKKAAKEKTPERDAKKEGFASMDAFNSLKIRVGEIIRAEKHPDADKILKLEIDFGDGPPVQILSGIAEFYAPEELPGKKICAITNLSPRKIRGLISEGMVLTVDAPHGAALLEAPVGSVKGSKIS